MPVFIKTKVSFHLSDLVTLGHEQITLHITAGIDWLTLDLSRIYTNLLCVVRLKLYSLKIKTDSHSPP